MPAGGISAEDHGFRQTKKGLHGRVERGLSWDNGRELLVGDWFFEACWSCVRQRLDNFGRLNWTVTKAGGREYSRVVAKFLDR